MGNPVAAYHRGVLVADIARAVGIFVVTNVDDLILLSLFFGRAAARPGRWHQVVAGQYLGVAAIVVVSLLGAWGATLLAEGWTSYLGLVPLALGVREAVRVARGRSDDGEDATRDQAPGVWFVASVTLANGGDNIAVYVPVFANLGAGAIAVVTATFAAMTAVWCGAAAWITTRPTVARALARWGHVLLPIVLMALGITILVEGGAFGR